MSMKSPGNLPRVLLACLLAAGANGCAKGTSAAGGAALAQSPPPTQPPGVVSPSEQIANLKQLAEEAPKMDAGQRNRITAELIRRIQREEDAVLRSEMLRTLAACGGPAADAVLRSALRDPDADIRVLACGFCGKSGDAQAVQCLAAVLSADIDKDVRMAAARALGSAHDPKAIAVLGTALDDKDPAMQYCAVVALRKLTGRDLGNDVDRWRVALKSGALRLAARPHSWF
jgi:HEAT repeat protein